MSAHPALALLRAGQVAEAIAYLADQPALSSVQAGALALLRAGFIDMGAGLLEDEHRGSPGASQASPGCGVADDASNGPQHSETPVSVDVRRRA